LTEPAQQTERARQTETARTRWLDPAWQSEILAWIEAGLAERSIRVVGPVAQPHIRPWSTAISVPTDVGTVWFKAGGPGNAYEAALLQAMAGWRTPGILEPLAVEAARGWLLLPDGGSRLRDVTGGGPGLDQWERVLPQWAAIQRGLADHAGELVDAGVPDLRPATLPDTLATLTDDTDARLASDDRMRLRNLLPMFTDWCAELEAAGIEPSLQHDDLHDGNVFVGAAGDRIFDWGDASVSHPFGTLLVTFRSIASRGLGDLPTQSRALDRLRDVYLETWTDKQPLDELRRVAVLAMRTAIVGRSLSWKRALTGVPPRDHGEWAGNVGGWLMDLFEEKLV
jgi:hypothetical protein